MNTTAVEDRYRRLLRWFPAQWREHREEEVLAVLLEGASQEGRTHPTVGERWDLARHGLTARLESLASLDARRRIALLAALSGAALCLGCLVVGELLPWLGPLVPTSGEYTPARVDAPGYGLVLYSLWLIAAVLTGLWRSRPARQLFVAVALLAWSAPALPAVADVTVPPLYFCIVLGFLAALSAAADVAPRFGRTRTDVLRSVAAVVLGAAVIAVLSRPDVLWWTGDPAYAFYRQWPVGILGVGHTLVSVVPAGVAAVLLVAVRRRRMRPWVSPVLVVAVPWMELALLAGVGSTARSGLAAAATVAVVAAVVGTAAVAGLRVTVPSAHRLSP